MTVLETLKKVAEKAIGSSRPAREHVEDLVRARKANAFRFKDDGVIPNNARWPLVLYRGALSLPNDLDPAAIMEVLFDRNGWGDSWRNGIYDYVHYHSRIHEVLGIAKGKGTVRFGGNNGRTIQLKAGDVAVLPAGTGHQCLAASKDFLSWVPTRRRAPTMNARKVKIMAARSRRFPRWVVRERTPSTAQRERYCQLGSLNGDIAYRSVSPASLCRRSRTAAPATFFRPSYGADIPVISPPPAAVRRYLS